MHPADCRAAMGCVARGVVFGGLILLVDLFSAASIPGPSSLGSTITSICFDSKLDLWGWLLGKVDARYKHRMALKKTGC